MNLPDIIPYLVLAMIAVSVAFGIMMGSRLLKIIREWRGRSGDYIEDIREQRKAEGMWFQLGMMLQVGIFIVVLFFGFNVIIFLTESPPGVSLFDQMVDALAILVPLIIVFWLVKTVPYLIHRKQRVPEQ